MWVFNLSLLLTLPHSPRDFLSVFFPLKIQHTKFQFDQETVDKN